MKEAGGFDTRWMTEMINNIVKEDCNPDDCRKSTLVSVYKGKDDPHGWDLYRAIQLLEKPMMVLEIVLERGSDIRFQLVTCSLTSCLAMELLMIFSSWDKFRRGTKQGRRSCYMRLWIWRRNLSTEGSVRCPLR